MYLVGLTGGIATGKSTVSRILSSEHGCSIVDLDVIAREVVEPGTPAFRKIVAHFGADRVLDPATGSLDRRALGAIIFADPSERKYLESITHPAIYKAMFLRLLRLYITTFFSPSHLVILDAPLLFEAGKLVRIISASIVVTVDPHTQFERLCLRNPDLPEQECRRRIAAQMPLEKKCELATHVIDNNGSLDDAREQTSRVVEQLQRKSKMHFLIRMTAVASAAALGYVACCRWWHG